MSLLRLALIEFQPPPHVGNHFDAKIGDVDVTTLGSETNDERLLVLLSAEIVLERKPKLATGGLLVVPERERNKAEAVLETIANVVAVSGECRRTISSPMPCVAFRFRTDEARAWRRTRVRGIHGHGELQDFSTIASTVDFTEDILRGLADRFDGVALLAEAFSTTHAMAQLREFHRLFERAFTMPARRTTDLLLDFLPRRLGYTASELKEWVRLRDRGSHADVRADFALEADARPVLSRIEQAALDVLLNKAEWRSPATARRELWVSPAWTGDEARTGFALLGSQIRLGSMLLDPFGVYPTDLQGVSSKLPDGAWSPDVPHGTKPFGFRALAPEELNGVVGPDEGQTLRPLALTLAEQVRNRSKS